MHIILGFCNKIDDDLILLALMGLKSAVW